VKLLFDQNLSPRLANLLADAFPGSAHVDNLGLGAASDLVIWRHAVGHGFAIVTKDEDFSHLSVLRGVPPKVLWLLLGNCSTRQVEQLLRARRNEMFAFNADPVAGVLGLG
jgi:predicted nuclease of predicted toxin-antitoxin system